MSFVAVCDDCDYEASGESEDEVRQQIINDGGSVEDITPSTNSTLNRMVRHKKKKSENLNVIDLKCPSGHRLDMVHDSNRDLLPLRYARQFKRRIQNE